MQHPTSCTASRGLSHVLACDRAEVDNAIDVPHGGFHLGEIGEIGAHDLFAGACRIERRDVGKAQHRVAFAQAFA
jgi:hypothetical protein